jgi:hypothetical protein
VQDRLQKGRSEALLTQIGCVTFVTAARREHMPRKGGIHDHEKIFAREKKGFDGID